MSGIEAAWEAAVMEREGLAVNLARLNIDFSRRQHLLDKVPCQAELLEYLMRFEELHKHAGARETELQQCQGGLASLGLTREFMAKEVKLLDSVAGSLEVAFQSRASREEFQRQFKGVVQVRGS
ncbi:unnamed protein product [Choristocarpus tenellus]